MGNCDMCNAPIGSEAKLYSAGDMRAVVAAGYRVDTLYGLGGANAFAAGSGLSPEEAEQAWLQRVHRDTTDWALCPDCAAKIVPYLGKAQAPAPPTAPPTTEVVVEQSNQMDDRVKSWTEKIQSTQKLVSNRKLLSFVIGGLGPFVVTLVVFGLTNQGWVLCGGLAVSAVTWALLYAVWASRTEKRAAHRLANDIQQACEAEGLSKAEVVEALAAQAPSGGVRKAILTAVDAETVEIIDIGNRGQVFFTKKGAANESDALKFRGITLDYLSHKMYVESVAALGIASTVYAEIAPPFGENVDVDGLIRSTYDQSKRIQLATRKVLSSFDFEADLKAISEAGTKRRDASLLNLLLAAQTQGTDTLEALAEASEGLKPLIRDETLVGACVDYLGKRATQRIQALQALALIPDTRTLPYLLKVFELLPFYPQGIDAVVRLGESAHPQLLEALRAGNANCRYNVALALGIMEVEAARSIFTGLLNTVTNPTERIGCWYGLVRLGGEQCLGEIVQALDYPNGDVRHAAAIALEHLAQPLPDDVCLRHLTNANDLVRLRLTRKLGSQGTDNPALIDALIDRFADGKENVRSAAVDAVAKLGAEQVYDRMIELTGSGTGTMRDCAYQVLGRLADPRAEPLLTKALQAPRSADERRTIISALADLQAVGAAEQIGSYLSNKELSGAAFLALLRLGFADGEVVTKILRRHSDRPQRLFALTLLGDEKAKRQFRGMLSPSTDIQTLLQATDYARMLSNPDFEAPLRKLLNYSNQQYAPTDKYVPYTAFKALIPTLLAKA